MSARRSSLPDPDHPDLQLDWDARGRVVLRDAAAPRSTPIVVEFLHGPTGQRRAGIRRKTHPLARAVGRNSPLPNILDGTAGLGRDAFILACLGYQVTAVERSPVLHALLADGIARLLADREGAAWVGDRLRLECGDCREHFANPAPDVIYLDPMFPPRKKSALVKKEMRVFHQLLGFAPESDTHALFVAARQAATRRVVVKRPAAAPPLGDDVSYSVDGTSVRWDVYLTLDGNDAVRNSSNGP